MIKYYILLLASVCLLISCGSRKKIVYMQDIKSNQTLSYASNYDLILQPDDLLSIIVSAENQELTVPFNNSLLQTGSALGAKGFLIDSEGFIDYPIVGKIKVGGLTKKTANSEIVKKITPFFKTPPTINLSILNFKITVLGAVKSPNTFNITGNRVTLLEALTMAGDLIMTGKRNTILLIRETNGQKSFNRIDITNSSFINSPFYYLAQNDVLYIEPNKTSINNAAIETSVGSIISATSFLVSMYLLFFKK
jgi:polysaccharide biosynthesis/export protein